MLRPMKPRITATQFLTLIHETIPMTQHFGFDVPALEWGRARLMMKGDDALVRAGGSVSGPSLMTLVDAALYAAVLTRLGMEPMAVTSDLNIRFLKRPPPEDLYADAYILRMGRRQAVGEITVSGADGVPVVHATGTYALPQRPSGA